MTLQKKEEGIYIDNALLDSLTDLDAIIFDCDGVLINIKNSYDEAITKTTEHILKKYGKISNPLQITSEIIEAFKETGGFNDEVDVTYASILSLIAASKLNNDTKEFIFEVITNADSTGIKSVEKYLDGLTVDLSNIKKVLSYPGKHSENLLYSTFDQIFYGPELYLKLFGKPSEFSQSGLIENDVTIISDKLLYMLTKKFGDKIAIVTGRGIESIRYSLKELLEKFNIEHSVFLEDEQREFAKPNPESLLRSIRGLQAKHVLYVGDSMEDFIMAKKATEQGFKITFCGIIGTSKNPEQKKTLFEQNGALLILDSILKIPNILNLD